MPIVIRPASTESRDGSSIELSPADWNLETQLEFLEKWLIENQGLIPFTLAQVADVGYEQRKEPRGGGPWLTSDFMKLCVKANLDLCLSAYPSGDSSKVSNDVKLDANLLKSLKAAKQNHTFPDSA